MEHPRPVSAAHAACDFCRLKKAKCSKERPSCFVCIQNGVECHYSGKPIRSPLTRAYLSDVEHRVHGLETLFSQLLPDVDLEAALKNHHTNDSPAPRSLPQPEDKKPASESPVANDNLPLIGETTPSEVSGYDWTEDAASLDQLADGMAALRIEPTGTGFLGSTSGVVFLRSMLFRIGNPELLTQAHLRATELSGQSPHSLSASSKLYEASVSQHVKSKLIDSYFTTYHLSYPFVHEATFRAQYFEVIPRPQQASWNMLLYTILALGSWTSGQEQTELDDILYRRALSLGENESVFETANLTMVQALVLLSNLSQKRNRPNTGWNLLGLATRMAMSLGLHREHPNWKISLLHQEMRRRVWWGLFMFDSGASTTFGRAILLPDRDTMDVRPVLNVDDENLTPRTFSPPIELQRPTIYSGMKAQAALHLESNYISNRLLSSRPVSPDEALAMNTSLENWAHTLPAYFQIQEEISQFDEWYLFARARLWWRFWNLKIILFRQTLLRRSENPSPTDLEDKCRQSCLEAARLTISSINGFLTHAGKSRLVSWYSTYFLFHASLIVLLVIWGDSPTDLGELKEEIQVARNLFRNVLATNPSALKCAEALDRLMPFQDQHDLSTNYDFLATELPDLTAWSTDFGEFYDMADWQEGQSF